MTQLVKAASPEELQDQLARRMDDDDEDRPWWVHGEVMRHDGFFYQFLTDQNPNLRVTLVVDPDNITTVVKRLKREFPE
jgi:hypothetical protein